MKLQKVLNGVRITYRWISKVNDLSYNRKLWYRMKWTPQFSNLSLGALELNFLYNDLKHQRQNNV